MEAEKLNEKTEMKTHANDHHAKSPLKADIRIVLHTIRAHALFNGSWKHGKMGLLQFAKITSILWKAAREDDPYAEWYLLKIYQALHEAREKLSVIEKQLEPLLTQIRGIEVTTSLSTHPVSYPLQFSTPYGYMGAYLITDFDFVLRQVLTLEKMGIMAPQQDTSIKSLVQLIQTVFSLSREWKHTGVTRQDFLDKTKVYENARLQLGELPDSVLHKKIEFAFLPKTKGIKNDSN